MILWGFNVLCLHQIWFLGSPTMCSTPFYIQSYIIFFLNDLKNIQVSIPTVDIWKIRNISLKIFIVFQVHVSFVFLSNTFPSVLRGWVQFQFYLGHYITLKISTRLRFSHDPMNFGLLDAKWKSLNTRKKSAPSKKSKVSFKTKKTISNWSFWVSHGFRG